MKTDGNGWKLLETARNSANYVTNGDWRGDDNPCFTQYYDCISSVGNPNLDAETDLRHFCKIKEILFLFKQESRPK